MWQKLPVDMAVRLKSWAASRGGLPEVAGHAHSGSGSNSIGGGGGGGAIDSASGPVLNALRRPPQPPPMASA